MSDPVTVIAQYRVRPGVEQQFLNVVADHWATLHELGLVTDRPAEVFLGAEKGIDGPFVVEIFDWVDADASARAHTHPRVSGTWERMGPMCEERGGRPPLEFPTVRRVSPA